MIIIRREVLDNYLKAINKNYAWLARETGYTKGYLSQIINDGCKISANVIDRMTHVTNISYHDLFLNDGKPDLREFCGEVFTHEGEVFNRKRYYSAMRQKRQEMSLNK